ncbi:MAG: hypothetical protein ACXWBS_04125 [Chthoniobacterales bacterium]
MNKLFVRYQATIVLSLLLQGCAFPAGKPPLPKQASIEQLPRPATETDYAAAVQNADIIYFPTERAASAGRSEPAALLLEALEKTQKPFAIGWGIISASQQPLLDQLDAATGNAREQLIGQLELVANGRAREHCRAVLRETRPPGVRYLALRCPSEVLGRINAGERLTSEDERFVARGYAAPSGGFDNYLSRIGVRNLGDPRLAQSYRAELVRREFAAEGIIRFFRKAGSENKLVVFASADDLDSSDGLPFFVAQKANVRQLVLGPNRNDRPKLLTRMRYIGPDSRS